MLATFLAYDPFYFDTTIGSVTANAKKDSQSPCAVRRTVRYPRALFARPRALILCPHFRVPSSYATRPRLKRRYRQYILRPRINHQ